MSERMPSRSTSSGTGVAELVVGIVSPVDPTSGRVMVLDQFNLQFEVNATLLPKGTGAPQPGERWLIVKRAGLWTLSAMVGLQATPTISGDVSGLDPVVQQILAALTAHGLIDDQTTGSTVDDPFVPLDDGTDPYVPDTTSSNDDGEPDDGIEDFPEEDDGYLPTKGPWKPPAEPDRSTPGTKHGSPDDEGKTGPKHGKNPKHGHDEDDPNDENNRPPKDHHKKVSRLTVVTYNQYAGLGADRVQSDVDHLIASRADVVMFQEAGQAFRRQLYANADPDWAEYRPGDARANTIIWNTQVLRRMSVGYIPIGPPTDGSPPQCFVVWVTFRHLDSGQIITVSDTHFDAWAAFGGALYSGKWKESDVVRFKQQMANLPGAMRTLRGHGGPVILGGDFNVNWHADNALRHEGLPFRVLTNVGFTSTYTTLGTPPIGTIGHGPSLFDQQWLCRNGSPNLIKPVWHKVFTGYYSDHRPYMVTYELKEAKSPGK